MSILIGKIRIKIKSRIRSEAKNKKPLSSLSTAGAAQYPCLIPSANLDVTGQTASVSVSTAWFSVPSGAGGKYRVSCYIILTTVATTSTLPKCYIGWTDPETSTATSAAFGLTSTGNTVGTSSLTGAGPTSAVIRAKAGTAITAGTGGYASSPAATMVYSYHYWLEYLGP